MRCLRCPREGHKIERSHLSFGCGPGSSGSRRVPCMSIASVAALVDTLRSTQLLAADQLKEVAGLQARFTDPRALAKELLQRGWLTSYQLNQLFRGRKADLRARGLPVAGANRRRRVGPGLQGAAHPHAAAGGLEGDPSRAIGRQGIGGPLLSRNPGRQPADPSARGPRLRRRPHRRQLISWPWNTWKGST